MHNTNVVDLKTAMRVLREAGYRVSKPRARKVKLTRVGPTAVVTFEDGEVFRLSIHTSDEVLNYKRGIAVATAAYEIRHKDRFVPPVKTIHFERDGVVLGERKAA